MSGWSVIAGAVSTGVFALASLPMVVKAARTRDLASYSGGNLALANAGNVIHWLYVVHLPVGPVWALHAFNSTVAALMFSWWLRERRRRATLGPDVAARGEVATSGGETVRRLR
ncbi:MULTISPECIES: hypothetical protein [unclassified Blastococcus]